MMKKNMQEIKPPWIAYPGYPPGDFFWRDAGDAYYGYAWDPFWQQLNDQEKTEYLDRWDAPEEWRWWLLEFYPTLT